MNSIGLKLYEAANLLKREFERESKPFGLTMLQWRVLASLSDRDGLTQTCIGLELKAGAMSISDVMERLEQAGLITREVDPSDSRAKLAYITAKGAAQRAEMRGLAEAIYDKTLEGISPSDLDATERVLLRIAENLSDQKNSNSRHSIKEKTE